MGIVNKACGYPPTTVAEFFLCTNKPVLLLHATLSEKTHKRRNSQQHDNAHGNNVMVNQ